MRINLVKVGNSKGIIIPAAILASCGLKDAVDLQIKGKKLVIEALKQPRAGWFEGYQSEHDEAVLDTIPVDKGDEEWVWQSAARFIGSTSTPPSAAKSKKPAPA